MSLIPRCNRLSRIETAFCSYQDNTSDGSLTFEGISQTEQFSPPKKRHYTDHNPTTGVFLQSALNYGRRTPQSQNTVSLEPGQLSPYGNCGLAWLHHPPTRGGGECLPTNCFYYSIDADDSMVFKSTITDPASTSSTNQA